ncbi:MAG: hypothetical protein A3J79_14675 [Elusimicrobia bacterium RIFOXYB2_FULL_62_6]|nr:MAG: hypothetical protein A3J79_14675 [Elusimicrobia bacterium RIFOXYB2_FULL_62_6]
MKIFISVLAACLLFAAAARAGDDGKAAPAQPVKKETPKAKDAPKAKEARKAKAPVSAEAAKAAPPAAPAATGLPPASPEAAALSELMKWDDALFSLRARFTQEFDFAEAGLKQHIEGALDYKKPDFLRIEHIKPARQIVYTDKTDLWVYKPEDSQVLKTSWAAWKSSQNNNLSGILDFGNYSALTRQNTVAVSTAAGSPYITVTFTPKSETQNYKLSLTLSATDYFPAGASLTVDKTVITTTLESVERNIPIDDSVFKFIQPKGTELLEFKN